MKCHLSPFPLIHVSSISLTGDKIYKYVNIQIQTGFLQLVYSHVVVFCLIFFWRQINTTCILFGHHKNIKLLLTFYSRDFHCFDQHPRQPERYLLWKLIPVHGYLETVPEIYVQNLAAEPVQHEIGGMAVPQSQNVTDHRHDCQGSCVICSAKNHVHISELEGRCQFENYLRLNHTSDDGLFNHKSRARSSPWTCSSACSNTSTFCMTIRWS